MSDFQKYKKKRTKQDPEFWKDYDENFETFRLGVMLKQTRKEAGVTQEQASELKTTKSVIFRMENHANDIRLSTDAPIVAPLMPGAIQ